MGYWVQISGNNGMSFFATYEDAAKELHLFGFQNHGNVWKRFTPNGVEKAHIISDLLFYE